MNYSSASVNFGLWALKVGFVLYIISEVGLQLQSGVYLLMRINTFFLRK